MSDSPDDSVTIEVRYHSEPFGDDPPDAHLLYEALGRVVVLWGRLEQALDHHARMVLNIAATHGIEQDMQISLSRKIKALKEVYKICPAFSDLKGEFLPFLDRLKETGDDRHLLIHSFVDHFEPGNPSRLVMHNVDFRGGKIVMKTLKPGIGEIASVAGQIDRRIGELLAHFFTATQLQPGYEKARKAQLQAQSEGDPSSPTQKPPR